MKRSMQYVVIISTLIISINVSGCSQLAFNNEGDLRTVSVTNNPNIIPQKETRGMGRGVPY